MELKVEVSTFLNLIPRLSEELWICHSLLFFKYSQLGHQ